MNLYVLGALGLGAWWLLSRRQGQDQRQGQSQSQDRRQSQGLAPEKPGAEKPIVPPAPIISPVKVSATITPPSQIPVPANASPAIVSHQMEASEVQQQAPNLPRWVSEIDVLEPLTPTSESGGLEIRTDGSRLTVTETTEA